MTLLVQALSLTDSKPQGRKFLNVHFLFYLGQHDSVCYLQGDWPQGSFLHIPHLQQVFPLKDDVAVGLKVFCLPCHIGQLCFYQSLQNKETQNLDLLSPPQHLKVFALYGERILDESNFHAYELLWESEWVIFMVLSLVFNISYNIVRLLTSQAEWF